YVRTWEFPAGFMTQYQPSMIVADDAHQHLATGYPIGKRFKSAVVSRVADGNPVHLGHHATADGRWRLYVFADRAGQDAASEVSALARWLSEAPESPLVRFTPRGADADAVFDVKVVYQQPHGDVEVLDAPEVFRPFGGPFHLMDYEKVYSALPDDDIFDARGIDRDGVVVVVRPDQYVSAVLPLTATAELAAFFDGTMLVRG
ncbi:MAG: 3-hydroxybenzoate 4-monooxygenase, partial [Humibacter sp.]